MKCENLVLRDNLYHRRAADQGYLGDLGKTPREQLQAPFNYSLCKLDPLRELYLSTTSVTIRRQSCSECLVREILFKDCYRVQHIQKSAQIINIWL